MTIGLAVRRKDQTWIGADTLTVCDNSARFQSKVVKFNDQVYIVASGLGETQTILEEMATDSSSRGFDFNTTTDIRTFARVVYGKLKEYIDISPKFDDDAAEELIIVTATSIFTVDRFLDAIEHKKFAAIGAGAREGKTALDIYYNEMKLKERDIVKKALEKSCKYVISCGKPLTIIQVGGK